jgi:hypothetical protein
MTNPFYNATGYPADNSASAPATADAEFAAIATGFAALPTFSPSVAGSLVQVNAAGTALVTANSVYIDSNGILRYASPTKPWGTLTGYPAVSGVISGATLGSGWTGSTSQGGVTVSTSAGTITVPVAGRYRCYASVLTSGGSGAGSSTFSNLVKFQGNGSDLFANETLVYNRTTNDSASCNFSGLIVTEAELSASEAVTMVASLDNTHSTVQVYEFGVILIH